MDVLMPERFRAAHQQHLHRFSQTGETQRMMGLGLVKGLRSDGQEIDLEVTISQLVVQGQKVLMANLRDVTQRVRSEAVFEQSRAQLSELTHKLMLQEKTLVKGLAQALHDQLGQTMAAIRMAHETILTLQGDQVAPGMRKLQAQLGALISQAIRQVRQVLTDLRPPLLDEHGLAAALDNELRNRSLKVPQIDISVHVQPQVAPLRWPPEVEYAAFMVAREAVENALRHSGATAVATSLSGSGLYLSLEVSDNGTGMPADAAARAGHLGILGMQERAHAIGAGVTVDSGATGGTRVCFTWQSTPLL
jgi:signal transduction histidine kinase